jgi:hypothetical protein
MAHDIAGSAGPTEVVAAEPCGSHDTNPPEQVRLLLVSKGSPAVGWRPCFSLTEGSRLCARRGGRNEPWAYEAYGGSSAEEE